MEGELNGGDATSRELLRQLMSLQADMEAIKEAQVLLLKVLVNFPAGQTPQRWLHAVREKAFCELELKLAAFRDALPSPAGLNIPPPAFAPPKPPSPQELLRLPRVPLPPPALPVPPSPFQTFASQGVALKNSLLHLVRGKA